MSHGYATGTGSAIYAHGQGARALGRATSAGVLSATANAATAIGNATTNAITASGLASFALGDSTSGAITASATNSLQLGPGTNSQALSLQVGDTTNGIRLTGGGAAPGTPHNGDIWVASTNTLIQSGGTARNLSTPITKTITIEDPVAESVFFFYTPFAITLSQVRALIQGGTSIPVTLASGTTYLTVVDTNVNAQTASNTTTGADLTIADTTIAAGSNVWLTLGTPNGTQTLLTVTAVFKET
jgi:hypothetical protein